MPTAHAPSDLGALWDRCRTNAWLKTVGITAFITLFFVAYFRILNFPLFPVTVMPFMEVDRWIPFTPAALVLYVSLWVYVPIAPGILPSKRELGALCCEACGVALVGLGAFIFWPTTIPLIEIDWTQHPGFEFLKTVDASGNACPSLHVAFAVFTAIRIQETLSEIQARTRFHVINWLWCVSIVYSTLAIKQHVAVDAIVGTALGVLGGKLHWTRWLDKRNRAALGS